MKPWPGDYKLVLQGGILVNASMIRNGYVSVMTTPPNVKYAGTFEELARKERKWDRGLWNQVMNHPDNRQGVTDLEAWRLWF